MKKNESGITLIALIITIVVILILVAVTISITLGENGIIKKAQEARTGYAGAEGKENTELTGTGVEEKINSVVNGGETTITTGGAQLVSFSELNVGDEIIIKIKQNENVTITATDGGLSLTNGVDFYTQDSVESLIDANNILIGYFEDSNPDLTHGPLYLFLTEGTTCIGQTVNKTGWYETSDLETLQYVEGEATFEGTIEHIRNYDGSLSILEQIADVYKK